MQAHHVLARQAAARSAVLLKNEGDLLPIAPGVRLAVVGEFARTPRYQGAGSSQVNPTRLEVMLDELHTACGDIAFAPGYRIAPADEAPVHAQPADDDLVAEAVHAAGDAEVVLVVLGLPADHESEGLDRTHMDLPVDQLAPLAAVAGVNENVVVVLVNGSAVLLGEVLPHARALVEAWLGGQAAGGAIVDVLCGAVEASGRLAETIPYRLQDNSSYLNFPGEDQVVRYGEGVFVGYRGYDASDLDVAFPFGYGLSYTTFEMSGLDVATSGAAAHGDLAVTVNVTVTNTGRRAGREVVQVYVHDVEASVARPPRELKGFATVHLEPRESRQVEIVLDQRAFSFWSPRLRRWVVEAGEFVVGVGRHSRDLPVSHTLQIEAPSIRPPITADSTLAEWAADPLARVLIAEAVAAGAPDPLRDPELVRVVGTMPMSTIAAFTGLSLDAPTLAEAARAWRERSRLAG